MATATKTAEVMDLDLSLIVIDPDIQPRETMDHDVVSQYGEDMLAGVSFPPVVVYHDGSRYWLSQGFHRCTAAESAGYEAINAEIRPGTRDDALLDAAGSNCEHDAAGMRRTNADKRRAVRMALEAKPEWSDRRIAEHVGVSKTTVLEYRREQVVEKTTSNYRVGSDGKSYPATNGRRSDDDMPVRTTDEGWSESKLQREVEEQARIEALEGQKELPITAPDPDFQLAQMPASIDSELKPASRPTFNQTNDMVDWARWTWNPVTGCEHTCFYCYARDIANRFYPEKFTPTFRGERLDAPRNTRLPGVAANETDPIQATAWRNVFVCSMADLFGRWVPQKWIDDVFDSCRKSPEWNYLFLTKFPQRYVDLDFPETAWVGTSVDEQKRVANAEKAFRKIQAPVKWLSIEPMLEPIKFTDLSMFDWVVIGGQSRSSGGPESFPDPDWIVDLIHEARRAGCAVYCKPNTDPDAHWAGIYQQYPSAFAGESNS